MLYRTTAKCPLVVVEIQYIAFWQEMLYRQVCDIQLILFMNMHPLNVDFYYLLGWTIGLDYWTGLLDWTTGLDYWTRLLD